MIKGMLFEVTQFMKPRSNGQKPLRFIRLDQITDIKEGMGQLYPGPDGECLKPTVVLHLGPDYRITLFTSNPRALIHRMIMMANTALHVVATGKGWERLDPEFEDTDPPTE